VALVGLLEDGNGGEAVDIAEYLWPGLQQGGEQVASLEVDRHLGRANSTTTRVREIAKAASATTRRRSRHGSRSDTNVVVVLVTF
jgi:hypothetical protein